LHLFRSGTNKHSQVTQGFQSGPVPGILPHAQTAIYDSKVKLFLKQGISRQLGRDWTQLFDLNARIQQLRWSLIFYEKYSTSQSYLWFWPPLTFWGGSVISTGTIHDLRRVKVPGTSPLWNPCLVFNECFKNNFTLES
jgi:hypothetical protein